MNILYYNQIGETFESESDLDRLLEIPGLYLKINFGTMSIFYLNQVEATY